MHDKRIQYWSVFMSIWNHQSHIHTIYLSLRTLQSLLDIVNVVRDGPLLKVALWSNQVTTMDTEGIRSILTSNKT